MIDLRNYISKIDKEKEKNNDDTDFIPDIS